MTEQEALLRAVVTTPDDDTVRLVYADWLDENADANRARFIRLQIEMAKGCGKCDMPDRTVRSWGPYDPKGCDFGDNGYIDPCPRCGELGELETDIRSLLDWNGSAWLAELGLVHPAITAGGLRPTGEFRRGFLTDLDLNLYSFYGGTCDECRGGGERIVNMRTPPRKCQKCEGLGYTTGMADKLFSTCPIEKVTLNDRGLPATHIGPVWYNVDRIEKHPSVPLTAEIPGQIFDLITGYQTKSVGFSRWKAFNHSSEA